MNGWIAGLVVLAAAGCGDPGCLEGDEPQCEVPSPCTDLQFSCSNGESIVRVATAGDALLPGGPDALGSPGDVILANDQVVAVIDAIDHPHYISPTGGAIVDLARRNANDDGLRHIFQATGLLPDDAPHYTEYQIFDEGEVKAVQFRGVLDGHPDVHVATRYEIRPCEPGVRVRTEVVNLSPDPQSWFVADAFYWGGRESLPFTPAPGVGFVHPSFGLTTIQSVFQTVPFMVGAVHVSGASYGIAECQQDDLTGFESEEFSAVGRPTRIVMPRDYQVFERFISVGQGPAVSTAADPLLEVRRQLWGEPWVELKGRLTVPAGDPGGLGELIRASVVISEGTPQTPVIERTPWTQAVPDANGNFSARVPANRSYVIDVESYGQNVASATAKVGDKAFDLGDVAVPGVGELSIDVQRDGVDDWANVFLYPSAPASVTSAGMLYGSFVACNPMLGNPWGGSPACNRVLVNGPTKVKLLPGTYDVYASVGPFQSIARVQDVKVEAGSSQSVALSVETLEGLQPEGTLTGDFHVHGRGSFDSSIPDIDRVEAFLTAGIDVIISTEHDVVNDYAAARVQLGADQRLSLVSGTETTGHILFDLYDNADFPKVIGHWIAWPVPYDAEGPWRGAPWDELVEPGGLLTRLEDAGWSKDTGIFQLNHPWGGLQFGRDYAWPTAIGLDTTKPLDRADDGTGQSLFLRKPPGARYANSDYDVQEVMNSSNNWQFLQYRAIWYYLLNQGVVRGGTANSDSHSLTESVLGTPRNIVFADTHGGPGFDLATFDQAVRDGHMIGTNGPIVQISTTDASGATQTPSVHPFVPEQGAKLSIHVTAAPWVPIDEIRVVVDGAVVRTIDDLPVPPDPFAGNGADLVRYDGELDLGELLPATGDAWVVVEAGQKLMENADLDCNGIPDTGDNNGDGKIDWRDVADLDEDPGPGCLATVGPLAEPSSPKDRTLPWYQFNAVVPDGYATGFTNPLVLDRDGGGFSGVKQ